MYFCHVSISQGLCLGSANVYTALGVKFVYIPENPYNDLRPPKGVSMSMLKHILITSAKPGSPKGKGTRHPFWEQGHGRDMFGSDGLAGVVGGPHHEAASNTSAFLCP